jgi:hypothetical protein
MEGSIGSTEPSVSSIHHRTLNLALEVQGRLRELRKGQEKLLAYHASSVQSSKTADDNGFQAMVTQDLEVQVAALNHTHQLASAGNSEVPMPEAVFQPEGKLRSSTQSILDQVLDQCQSHLSWQGTRIEEIIADFNPDDSSDLSVSELAILLARLGVTVQGDEQLQLMFADLCGQHSGRVSIDKLRCRLILHRERHQLADLLTKDVDFPHLIARLVLPSTADNLRTFATKDVAMLMERLVPLASHVASAVLRVTSIDAQAHSDKSHASAEGINSKFAMESKGEDGLISAMFGDVGLFRRGLDDLIGRPSADVEKAMANEHCSDPGADSPFETKNYGTTVHTPREEYEFVMNPCTNKIYPCEVVADGQKGRVRKLLRELLCLPQFVAAKVTREEVAALR